MTPRFTRELVEAHLSIFEFTIEVSDGTVTIVADDLSAAEAHERAQTVATFLAEAGFSVATLAVATPDDGVTLFVGGRS